MKFNRTKSTGHSNASGNLLTMVALLIYKPKKN
jgi:hypothetical protein